MTDWMNDMSAAVTMKMIMRLARCSDTAILYRAVSDVTARHAGGRDAVRREGYAGVGREGLPAEHHASSSVSCRTSQS